MSNLKSAKQAIQAELLHAQEGAAFYQSRIAALEDALTKLESVDTNRGQAKKSVRGKSTDAPRQDKKAKPVKTQAGAATGSGKLPSTGKGFWPSLITTEPQSVNDILDAAIKTLGITPSKEQLKKLVQRQTNALHQLVKAKVISDSGSGRDRRFFRTQ